MNNMCFKSSGGVESADKSSSIQNIISFGSVELVAEMRYTGDGFPHV